MSNRLFLDIIKRLIRRTESEGVATLKKGAFTLKANRSTVSMYEGFDLVWSYRHEEMFSSKQWISANHDCFMEGSHEADISGKSKNSGDIFR